MGEIERSRAADLLGVGARQARNIVTKLIEKELLVSAGPGAPLRLGFPATVVEWWFPKLYPELRNP